jgi:prophage DNA circulation protein
MTWLDELGRVRINGKICVAAAFRGAVFFVEESELSGGRKGPDHEYPYQDDPYGEDLGRKGRTLSLTGYVIGAEYRAQKKALVDAAEAAGPGELLDPYNGKRTCICRAYSVRETLREGGFAAFSFTFRETPAQQAQPTPTVDFEGAIKTAADEAKAGTKTEFLESYDVENQPAFSLTSLEEGVRKGAQAMDDVYSSVVDDPAAFRRRINNLINDAAALVVSPLDLFDAIVETAEFVFAPPSIPAALLDAMNRLFPPPAFPYQTATRQKEKVNFLALDQLQRRALTISACRRAAEADFETLEEAEETRVTLAEQLDSQMDASTNDDTYQALGRLRSRVIRGVPSNPAKQPADLRTLRLHYVEPALVIAYRLYQDPTRELELTARNRIPHPGFVLGGTTIEVASA